MKNNTINLRKKESGQIIILLAVSLVVVMVVAALAVDGGMIYSERRFAQNAADSSSLAGGGAILNADLDNDVFTCPPNSSYQSELKDFSDKDDNIIAKAYIAASNAAKINNISELPFLGYFVNDNSSPVDGELKSNPDFSQKHGVIIRCKDSDFQTKIDVDVKITSQISTAFAHLIYPGDLVTTNEAIVTNLPGGRGSYGFSLITTGTDCTTKDCGIYISSSKGTLKISGGDGAYSKTCFYLENEKTAEELLVDGNINVTCASLDDKSWTSEWLLEQINLSTKPIPIPEPVKNPKDECDSITTTKTWKSDATVSPGKYDQIMINNKTVNFEDGLYCVVGDIVINSGIVRGGQPKCEYEMIDGKLTAKAGCVEDLTQGVTFYQQEKNSKDQYNTVSITGGDVKLSAPLNKDAKYYGLLFYLDGKTPENKTVNIVGNAETYLSGMFYAPDRWVNVSGDDKVGTTLAVTFIVKYITISGGGAVEIVYDGQAAARIPSKMYLQK
jgi:hypothetical protein